MSRTDVSMKKIIFGSILRGSVLAIILMAVLVYFTQSMISRYSLKNTAEVRLADAKERLAQSSEDIARLTEELSEEYLAKTRAFSQMVALSPEILDDSEKLEEIRVKLNVDELHVTDAEGVIRWSTIPGYLGFDFKESGQTLPFMKCIEDPSYELAQEPQPNGALGIMFQYIGVPRYDEPGIVQIGMEPTRLNDALKDNQPNVILGGITVGKDGSMFAVSKADGTLAAFMDEAYLGKAAGEASLSEDILNMGEGKIQKIHIDDEPYFACVSEMSDYYIGTLIPTSEATGQTVALTAVILLLTLLILLLLSGVIIRTVNKNIVRNVANMEESLQKITAGQTDIRMGVQSCRELSALSSGFNHMLDGIEGQIAETERLNDSMKRLLDDVSQISQRINGYSNEMKGVSDRISDGSAAQATTVEALNTAFLSVSKDVRDNAEAAGEVSRVSKSAGAQLKEGVERMAQVRDAMGRITEYSHQIEKIVKTIDDIAFQTNILALNAAVEAARAGVHGKGFAVVADEVRNLANKSAEAANNTTELIAETLHAVENGNVVADTAAEELRSMMGGIEKSIALIAEISEASTKQAHSMDSVTEGMRQIAEVAQSNLAISQSAQETSERLDSEAGRLIGLVQANV